MERQDEQWSEMCACTQDCELPLHHAGLAAFYLGAMLHALHCNEWWLAGMRQDQVVLEFQRAELMTAVRS